MYLFALFGPWCNLKTPHRRYYLYAKMKKRANAIKKSLLLEKGVKREKGL